MYGMMIAHFGIGIFIFGVVFTSAFSDQKEIAVRLGNSVELAGYTFTLQDVKGVQGPNYNAMRGYVEVEKDGVEVTMLYPEKRVYSVQRNPMTEAGIQSGFFRDLYVALGEPVSEQEWGFRVFYRPFVQWIWLGTIFMAIGGILGATDRRYRTQNKKLEQRVDNVSAPTTS